MVFLRGSYKCLKCHRERNLDLEPQYKLLEKDGCFFCHSKNLQVEKGFLDIFTKVVYQTEPCAKCSLIKVVKIVNWQELKPLLAKRGYKTEQELINEFNKEWEYNCSCKSEASTDPNQKYLWIIGVGLVVVVLFVIGLIIYLVNKKDKKSGH